MGRSISLCFYIHRPLGVFIARNHVPFRMEAAVTLFAYCPLHNQRNTANQETRNSLRFLNFLQASQVSFYSTPTFFHPYHIFSAITSDLKATGSTMACC